ncbi:MAG: hypothetical protein ACPL28_10315 [bacterium]
MPSSLDSRFSNIYEPVFLFIKQEAKYNYYLSIDELRLPVSNFSNDRKPEDIIGYEVENNLLRDKKKRGRVSRVFLNNRNEIFAEVEWEDGNKTLEVVQNFNKESQISAELVCHECGKNIRNIFDINNHNDCHGFPKPVLQIRPDFSNKIEVKPALLFQTSLQKKRNTGKFKLSPDNRGASPGARKSLYGEYLVLQRRYEVFQPIIADYLRFWREKRGITVKEIDKLLGYRDTQDTGSGRIPEAGARAARFLYLMIGIN